MGWFLFGLGVWGILIILITLFFMGSNSHRYR